MGVWDIYEERMSATGLTRRDARLRRLKDSISRRVVHSLSYHDVLINDVACTVAITKTAEKTEKNIMSMPGEHIPHGGLVEYEQSMWLVTELDAESEVYDKGLMVRCNHVLKWTSKDGTLKTKWCVVEDGTKYLIGEKAAEILTIGDSRIALTVPKDEDTVELKRGMRFLINDEDSEEPLAYQITKSNKLFNVYNGAGVFRFILNEVESIPNDDHEMHIAGSPDWRLNMGLDGEETDSAMTVVEIHEALAIEESIPPAENKEVWL